MNKLTTIIGLITLLLIVWILPAGAQKRVLVSPSGDAFPIGKGQTAAQIMKQAMARKSVSRTMVCDNQATFGFSPDLYPATTNHIGYHQDIMAMWYVAPASGTIDTVFWQATSNGSQDSTVRLRLFESNIYPGSGPGNGYPKPGRLCWGYFINTNDLDNGVSPFPEDATDTTWFSTVDGPTPSFTPMGNEIWGFGGFPVEEEANEINSIPLDVLGAPNLTVGDPFFITIRIIGPHEVQANEDATGFSAANEADSMATHNWKFYEHIVEIQPGFTCPGWVARGDFNILFWYSMTVTTNIPPIIVSQDDLKYSFDPSPKTVTAVIEDCNPANPGNAIVASAVARYSVDGGAPTDLPMSDIGGDTWETTIPSVPVGSSVTWKVVATDIDGAVGEGPPDSYRIVPFGTEWISIDNNYACVPQDISATGASIDSSAFFNPNYTGTGAFPKDDGTAGPFDMGDDFTVFGDTYRYAWIGVNGALSLSKSATDTIDVNSNGFATTGWDFPGLQHHGRADTFGTSRLPKMVVMPFWADHILADSAGIYGKILYGDAGDTCLFVVQWDSIGAFTDEGPLVDITTFRAILNRCTGVVEYQYESVGTTGLDSAALVGMQQDSTTLSGPVPGWVFYNRNGYPFETRPTDGSCVKLYPRAGTEAIDGWNIVGLSVAPSEGNYSKTFHYPEATSSAFRYNAGYTPADPLAQGEGYWLKFSGAGTVGAKGLQDEDVTATVADKWNLISGPSGDVPVGSIVVGGGTVSSSYYGYNGAYYTATTIEPGNGYWVKMTGAGTLGMTATGAVPKTAPEMLGQTELVALNKVVVRDAAGRSQTLYLGAEGRVGDDLSFYEMPPVPPVGGYDVRFSSQRMLEMYPDAPQDGQSYDFPVAIQGAVYPISISWEINAPVQGTKKLVLRDLSNAKPFLQAMEGSGSVTIKNPASKLALGLAEGVGLPAWYAMSQNYPNPFNPVTHFTVDLPKATDVDVAVYDLLGRKIASLLNGTQPAGQYTLEWNGRDANGLGVPTGMYFLRLSSEEFNATQKVMLMK